jgi:hypothetical protein
MKYYISHIEDTDKHNDFFSNWVAPYILLTKRAYVMDIIWEIEIEGEVIIEKKRSETDRQSVAMICCDDNYTAVQWQSLYQDLEECIENHKLIDYSMIGQAWVFNKLIPTI